MVVYGLWLLTCNLRGYLEKYSMLQDLDLSLRISSSAWTENVKEKQSELIRGKIVKSLLEETQKQMEFCSNKSGVPLFLFPCAHDGD